LSVAKIEVIPWVGVAVADRCVDADAVFETACRLLDQLRGGSVPRVSLAAGDAVGRVVTTRVTHGERVIDLTDFRQDDLVAYFQPIVDNTDGTVVAAEALARWRHPIHGVLTAGDFFGTAASAGMLGDLTDQALVNAAETWADLREGLPELRPRLFVNLSPEQMLGPMLPQRLVHLLRATNIPADELVVEITENALSSHLDDILAVMADIRSLGIRIALDDFGSGYSSLSRLRRMPVDVIKIDQELVAGLETDVKGQQMLGRLAAMADDLELEAVVEGVETAADALIVAELGFRYVQGYYYGHPVAADRFVERVMFPSSMARPA
jgi:EAL domain-containing protein (putative c-di-GMP-specific phosphodiesterase class I)